MLLKQHFQYWMKSPGVKRTWTLFCLSCEEVNLGYWELFISNLLQNFGYGGEIKIPLHLMSMWSLHKSKFKLVYPG